MQNSRENSVPNPKTVSQLIIEACDSSDDVQFFKKMEKNHLLALTEDEQRRIVCHAIFLDRFAILNYLKNELYFDLRTIFQAILATGQEDGNLLSHQAVVFLLDQGVDPNSRVGGHCFLFEYLLIGEHAFLKSPINSKKNMASFADKLNARAIEVAITLMERNVDLDLIQQYYIVDHLIQRMKQDHVPAEIIRNIRKFKPSRDLVRKIQHDAPHYVINNSSILSLFLHALCLKSEALLAIKPETLAIRIEIENIAFLHGWISKKINSSAQEATQYSELAMRAESAQRREMHNKLKQLDDVCCRYETSKKSGTLEVKKRVLGELCDLVETMLEPEDTSKKQMQDSLNQLDEVSHEAKENNRLDEKKRPFISFCYIVRRLKGRINDIFEQHALSLALYFIEQYVNEKDPAIYQALYERVVGILQEDVCIRMNFICKHPRATNEQKAYEICKIISPFLNKELRALRETDPLSVAVIGCQQALLYFKQRHLNSKLRLFLKKLNEAYEMLIALPLKKAFYLYQQGFFSDKQKAIENILFFLGASSPDDALTKCGEMCDFTLFNKIIYQKIMKVLLDEVYFKELKAVYNDKRKKYIVLPSNVEKIRGIVNSIQSYQRFLSAHQKEIFHAVQIALKVTSRPKKGHVVFFKQPSLGIQLPNLNSNHSIARLSVQRNVF